MPRIKALWLTGRISRIPFRLETNSKAAKLKAKVDQMNLSNNE
jgi:acylphosphatase